MAIIKCPECGHQVSDHAKTCPSCGVDIAGNIVRCPECGELTFAYNDMCPVCHHALKSGTAVRQQSAGSEADTPRPAMRQQFVSNNSTPNSAPQNEEDKKGRHPVAVALVFALVASLAVVFLGIYLMDKMDQQNETDAYERAVISGEPLILQDYLLRYPQAPAERRDSVEKVLARLQKIELDWQNAYSSKDRNKILAFIDKYPQNKHVREGRITLDSLAWVQACDANTAESYEAYLKEYSNQGDHSDEATLKIDEIKARLAAEEKARADSIAAAEEKLKAEQPKPAETKKPETKKPETKKVETKKPETKKPETKKPETKKVETKKETKKPETKKTETKKVETKKK